MTVGQFAPFNLEDPRGIKRRIIVGGWTAFGFGTSSYTVPGGALWRPVCITCTLTTSATAGNRIFRLQYNMEGGNTFYMETGTLIPASTAWTYNFWVGMSPAVDGTNGTSVGMPDVILVGGEQLAVQIVGTKGGDALTLQNIWVDEVWEQEGAPPPERVSLGERFDTLEEMLLRLRS